jgi:hypothetical protein
MIRMEFSKPSKRRLRISEEDSINQNLKNPQVAMELVHDLKNDLSDFCTFWECSRFGSHKVCTFCPVVKDIKDMANEQDLQPSSWLPAYSIY